MGVRFVSLTNMPRAAAERFRNEFDVPWPCGYGASDRVIASFGAYSNARMSSGYNPGYELSPTLYLIGPDGRVLWNDRQARMSHTGKEAGVGRALEAAIERELPDAPRGGGVGQ
jgi:hypothetical protein